MSAERIVQEFCDRMVHRDAESLRPYLAPDASYQNVGQPATAGADAIVAELASQFERFPDSYEYTTLNSLAQGNLVMNERLDHFRGADGKVHPLPVMGVFEVVDDKITRWTDYWDSNLIKTMLSGKDYSPLVPRS